MMRRLLSNRTVRRVFRSRLAIAAIVVMGLLVFVAILSPWLMPLDPAQQSLGERLQGPSSEHWLGTDSLGRDNLSRMIEGTRVTLWAVAQALTLAVVLGVPAGLVAGFVEGRADGILRWMTDTLLSLPPLILAIAIVGVLGTGLTNAMLALGIVMAPRFFRVARGAAISVSHDTYVEAARASGFSTRQILWRNILPNSSGPLLVQITFAVGLIVAAEASLSFLGLGVEDPTASWGSMLRAAYLNMNTAGYQLVAPCVAIVIVTLSSAIIGDALRDALGRQSRVGD